MIGRKPSDAEPTEDENRELNARLLQLEPGAEIRIYLMHDGGDRTLTVERTADETIYANDREVIVCSGYGTEYRLHAFTDADCTKYPPKVRTSTVRDSMTGLEIEEWPNKPADFEEDDMDSDEAFSDPTDPPTDDECEHLNLAIERLGMDDEVTVYTDDGKDRTLQVEGTDPPADRELDDEQVCRKLTGYGTEYYILGARRPHLDAIPTLQWSSGDALVYHLEVECVGYLDAEKTAGELLWRVGLRDGQ